MTDTVGTHERPLALTLLSGAVAAALVFPLTWVVVRAATVEPARAVELLAADRTVRFSSTVWS